MSIGNEQVTNSKAGVIDLYDNDVFVDRVVVDEDGGWEHTLSGLSHGVHVFSAQSEHVKSMTWQIQIRVPLDERTNFDDGTLGGWVDKTPVGSGQSDLSFVEVDEAHGISVLNITYTQQSAGAVLEKTYRGLNADKSYMFSVWVQRRLTTYSAPIVYLTANDVVISNEVTAVVDEWIQIEGITEAGAEVITFAVNNKLNTGYGNDYYMDDFHVRERQ